MKLDKTINVGTIIHLVTLIVSLLVMYGGLVSRMVAMETKVDLLWGKFQQEIDRLRMDVTNNK